jgi:pimeloyl-ACP methyl ester carboxylesterase
MLRGLTTRFIIFVITVTALPLQAHESRQPQRPPELCEALLAPDAYPETLKAVRERAESRYKEYEKTHPRREFTNIEVQAKREQSGDLDSPQSIKDFLGKNMSFVPTPAPVISADPASIAFIMENSSFPLHVDLPWAGHRTATTAYTSMTNNKTATAGGYLFGEDTPAVLVFLHGGGTPTASGFNGRSFGERGVPTLALDLPGHGRATANIDGLEDLDKTARWVLAQIKQLVAPGRKIVLSGHSYGAMLTYYMWLHSDEPGYEDVAEFISLAPGVDVSNAGDIPKKLAFEREWESRFRDFKGRIAQSDFEFQENMLQNGKDSDIGGTITTLTDFGYVTAPLSPERKAQLKKRMRVIVGENDGVVYVGREKEYAKAFGHLGDDFIVLPEGPTFKGIRQTGHNQFDLYDGPYENRPQSRPVVYTLIEEAVAAYGAPAADSGDEASKLMDWYFRAWANFPAFRELVRSGVEYVYSPTAQLDGITQGKKEIDNFVEKYREYIDQARKSEPLRLRAALDELGVSLDLQRAHEPARLQAELDLPKLTPEREAELKNYVKQVQEMEADLDKTFTDPVFDKEIAAVKAKFQAQLDKIQVKYEDYDGLLKNLLSRKDLSKEEENKRKVLANMHKEVKDLTGERQRRYATEHALRLTRIPVPKDIKDMRAARRELEVDRSETRRNNMREYLRRYDETVAGLHAQIERETVDRINALSRPKGLEDFAVTAGGGLGGLEVHPVIVLARQIQAEQNAVMTMTYAPPGDRDLERLSQRINAAVQEREALMGEDANKVSLTKLSANVMKLRDKRDGLVKRWADLWTKGGMSSALLDAQSANRQRALDSWKEIQSTYNARRSDWELSLHNSGQVTAANVNENMPREVKALRERAESAKQNYMLENEKLENVRWLEAAAGRITGGASKDAIKLARDLYGENFTGEATGMDSVAQQLKSEEEYLESRRRQVSMLSRKADDLRYKYMLKMHIAGLTTPYTVEQVPVAAALNRPLPEVLGELRTNPVFMRALNQLKQKWDDMLIELRQGVNSKAGDTGY